MEKKEPKKRTSFALSQKALKQLKELSEKENRSMANMIEVLLDEKYKKESTESL